MSGLLAIANPRRIKAAHRWRRKVAAGHRPYANNNPYKFIDPDGRLGCTGTKIEANCAESGLASAVGSMAKSARSVVAPTTVALGERGVPGTTSSNTVGAVKQLGNTALGVGAALSGNPATILGTPEMHIEDNELAGASAVELLTGVVPAFRSSRLTYLYQKFGPLGEHLKFGIATNPATRYTKAELAGGRLKILAHGPRDEMLRLERNLHETLPIGSEERQLFYIQKQIGNGLIPPPY